MSVNEELEEHVHHAQNKFDRVVAASMAITAALLAIVSVFGQHYNTEQILKQQQSSDQWAYYQAKDIRKYVAQATQDMLAQATPDSKAALRYQKDSERYKAEQSKIQGEARSMEKERDENGVRARQFHFGEVFLEVAIVLLSLSILTKRKPIALCGFVSAVVGVFWAAGGFFR